MREWDVQRVLASYRGSSCEDKPDADSRDGVQLIDDSETTHSDRTEAIKMLRQNAHGLQKSPKNTQDVLRYI